MKQKTTKKKKKPLIGTAARAIPCKPYWIDLGNGLKARVTGHVLLPWWMMKRL